SPVVAVIMPWSNKPADEIETVVPATVTPPFTATASAAPAPDVIVSVEPAVTLAFALTRLTPVKPMVPEAVVTPLTFKLPAEAVNEMFEPEEVAPVVKLPVAVVTLNGLPLPVTVPEIELTETFTGAAPPLKSTVLLAAMSPCPEDKVIAPDGELLNVTLPPA